jgi:hypothetical protein
MKNINSCIKAKIKLKVNAEIKKIETTAQKTLDSLILNLATKYLENLDASVFPSLRVDF